MSTVISVPDSHLESLLTLIKNYAICNCDITILRDPKYGNVKFQTSEGKSLSGSIAAARYIASLGSRSAQLLGNNAEDRSKIAEIISLTNFMSVGVLDSQLEVFNSWLQSRTFAVGNMVTLADLILYAHVGRAIANLPAAQHMHFCNVLRWYENIHFMADSGAIFPKIAFKKTKFSYTQPVIKPSQQANTSKKAEESKTNDSAAEKKEGKSKASQQETNMPSSKGDKPPKKVKGAASEDPTVDVLDIRVGLIKSIGPHPNADALYVEEIDLGEEKPRTVVSGLRKFVSEDEMKDRLVAVVCNLKPMKMRDILSTGMVLCASNADHTKVDPILIPKGSSVGSRIMFEGFEREPEAQINPKKKIFEKIAPHLMTDKDGVCMYKGVAMKTDAGVVTSSICEANIA